MGPGMKGSWNRNWSYSLNSPNNGWGYGPGNMMSWSGNWWSWIVIIAISTDAAVVLFRPRRSGIDGSRDALEILRSGYAEGKISREEYRQMSKELKE